MADVQAFFHMGGYAAYVWSAYALTFMVLLMNLLSAKNAHRKILSDVARRTGQSSHGVSTSAASDLSPNTTPTTNLDTESDISKSSQKVDQ